jgi:hypothetical protein
MFTFTTPRESSWRENLRRAPEICRATQELTLHSVDVKWNLWPGVAPKPSGEGGGTPREGIAGVTIDGAERIDRITLWSSKIRVMQRGWRITLRSTMNIRDIGGSGKKDSK